MDIRTKLALTMVSFSLLSMFLLGAFSYKVSADLLQEISERQLDALAESKRQDLRQVIDSWRNHVRLIRSRTQLRKQLKAYQSGEQPEMLADMQKIVEDAQESTEHVQRITLFDRAGNTVVAAGQAARSALAQTMLTDDDVHYAGFYIGPDEQPKVVFTSAVELDNEIIGSIEVVIDVVNLENLAGNYRGLGNTGETMIIGQKPSGELVVLHSLRHTRESPSLDDPPEYISAAVVGQERTFTHNVRDYRDEEVWAATCYLSDVKWGLVVKMDADEEMSRARSLRESMIDLALALGAFAVAGGTMLGFYLAKPIRGLVHVVRRVREGETALRADASKDDEIGVLAHALNEYLDHTDERRDRRNL